MGTVTFARSMGMADAGWPKGIKAVFAFIVNPEKN
jgi:hypothetical protein